MPIFLTARKLKKFTLQKPNLQPYLVYLQFKATKSEDQEEYCKECSVGSDFMILFE